MYARPASMRYRGVAVRLTHWRRPAGRKHLGRLCRARVRPAGQLRVARAYVRPRAAVAFPRPHTQRADMALFGLPDLPWPKRKGETGRRVS